LYFRLDDEAEDVINKRITEDIVLDVGADDKIIGIEVLNASKRIALKNLFPIEYETAKA
jgi:uncharacterized protein YuzE